MGLAVMVRLKGQLVVGECTGGRHAYDLQRASQRLLKLVMKWSCHASLGGADG